MPRILVRTVLSIAALFAVLGFWRPETPTQEPQFTSDNRMAKPIDYREWVWLSSGLGMTYESEGKNDHPAFDNVFASPAAYRAFVATGTWPDKTMLALEVRGSESHASINRGGRYQTSLQGIAVHVKDTRRFASQGGWAFYSFDRGSPARMIPADASCYSCHREHGAVDNTFVQFYPTLLDIAGKKGTLRSSY